MNFCIAPSFHSGKKINSRFLKTLLRNFTDLSLQFVPTFAFSLPSPNYWTSCKMAELTYNLLPTEALVVDPAPEWVRVEFSVTEIRTAVEAGASLAAKGKQVCGGKGGSGGSKYLPLHNLVCIQTFGYWHLIGFYPHTFHNGPRLRSHGPPAPKIEFPNMGTTQRGNLWGVYEPHIKLGPGRVPHNWQIGNLYGGNVPCGEWIPGVLCPWVCRVGLLLLGCKPSKSTLEGERVKAFSRQPKHY